MGHSCSSCGQASCGQASCKGLKPMDSHLGPGSFCDPLLVVDPCIDNRPACNLKATVQGVVETGGGRYSVTLAVTGNTEPVEISLNKKTYQPGLTVTGVQGKGVVIYVRQVYTRRCQTFVTVTLANQSSCTPPAAPVLAITNNTCEAGASGKIALSNTPPGVTTYWYKSQNGTGTAATTPPAYRADAVVSGSVRFARLDDPTCQSPLTLFQTQPAPCGCQQVGFGAIELPAASVGQFYTRRIPLTGSAPFQLGAALQKPSWLSARVEGSELVLLGVPLLADVTTGFDVSIPVTNCGTVTKPFSGKLSVISSCAEVEPDLTYEDSHCRPCVTEASYRIAQIVCYDDTKPPGGLCQSQSPVWRVNEIRCVSTTQPCGDKSSAWRVGEIRCATTTPGTPINPCSGVLPSWRVFDIKCTGVVTTPGPTAPVDPCVGKTSVYRITAINCTA